MDSVTGALVWMSVVPFGIAVVALLRGKMVASVGAGLFAFLFIVLALISASGKHPSATVAAATSPPATEVPATERPETPDPNNLMIGQTAKIVHGDGLGCASTPAHMHELIDAVNAHDDQGIRNAIYADGGFQLQNGDRVRVIQREGFAGLDERIRILSGAHEGEACWIQADLHIFG